MKKLANIFKLHAMGHFHPSDLQLKMIDTSFCAPVGLLLTNLNHFFNVSIDTNKVVFFLAIQSDS